MKRIYLFLLALIMILSTVSCGSDTIDNSEPANDADDISTENTSQPVESEDISHEQDNSNSESSAGWVTKDVKEITFTTTQQIPTQITFEEISNTPTVYLYKAPWADADAEAIASQLKTLPFVNGWLWATEYSETGYAQLYTDVGQQVYFDHSLSFTAKSPNNSESLLVTFRGDSNEYVGWKSIFVSFSGTTPEERQDDILSILKIVYGDIAEYMCYVPATKNNTATVSFPNDYGTNHFSRNVNDYSVHFDLWASNSADNSWEAYPGTYQSMLHDTQPKHYDKVFSNIGPFDFDNLETFGADFLNQWVKEYGRAIPLYSDKVYTYTYTKYENGDEDVEFSAAVTIIPEGSNSRYDGADMEMSYGTELRNGELTIKKAEISIPTISGDYPKDDYEDPDVIQHIRDNLTYTKQVANAVFNTDANLDEVYFNSLQDYKVVVACPEELFGRAVNMVFDFSPSEYNKVSINRGRVTISVG